MAQKKQPYNWNRVKPGDIISFRYKTESTGRTLTNSILVLNPKLPVQKKDGSSVFHLIGIKLEESNKISLRLNQKQITVLETIGEFKPIDLKNKLYELVIKPTYIINDKKGVKKQAYDKISRSLGIAGQYRTYDWKKAKKSAVYLEPIRVFTEESEDES
tara:strand:- start:610 stop:1086 length:477 start_codon:yes stop_codon:yes gene_type:complete